MLCLLETSDMRAGAGSEGEGANREVIISAPQGLLSGSHERKRLTPLSLRKACRGPLFVRVCVCVCVCGLRVCVTDGLPCYDPKSLTIFLKPSPPTHPPVSTCCHKGLHVCVDKQDCKKANVCSGVQFCFCWWFTSPLVKCRVNHIFCSSFSLNKLDPVLKFTANSVDKKFHLIWI